MTLTLQFNEAISKTVFQYPCRSFGGRPAHSFGRPHVTIRKFIALGVLWGVAMSAFVLHEFGEDRPRPTLLLVVCMFLAAGAIFGIGMFWFTRLLARYAGFDLSSDRKLKPGARNYLLIACGTVPSAAIVGFALLVQDHFLWAALAACIGPTLTLVRLPAQPIGRQELLVRCLLSVIVGALAAATVSIGILSLDVTPRVLITCIAYAAAWTLAQLIAVAVRPLFKEASREADA